MNLESAWLHAPRMARARRRLLAVALTSMLAGVLLIAFSTVQAGANGEGITADCEKVVAVKPMDKVRVRYLDNVEQTFNVDSTLEFVFPTNSSHGRVKGVTVTFDDGLAADRPVPACPATTTPTAQPTTTTAQPTTTTAQPTTTTAKPMTTTSQPTTTTTAATTTTSQPTTTTTAATTTTTQPTTTTSTSSSTTSTTIGGETSSIPSTSSTLATTTTTSGGVVSTFGTLGSTVPTGPTTVAQASTSDTAGLPVTGSGSTLFWLGVLSLGAGLLTFVGARRVTQRTQ
jgi:hypothetical protein